MVFDKDYCTGHGIPPVECSLWVEGSGNITKEELEIVEEQEGELACELLSSGYSMSAAHINSQQLELRIQDLGKIRAIKGSASQAKELLGVDGCK